LNSGLENVYLTVLLFGGSGGGSLGRVPVAVTDFLVRQSRVKDVVAVAVVVGVTAG